MRITLADTTIRCCHCPYGAIHPQGWDKLAREVELARAGWLWSPQGWVCPSCQSQKGGAR